MENILTGLGILALGAICGGSFGLPSKFVRKDMPWENLWGPFFFFATILIPVFCGPLLAQGFYQIYYNPEMLAIVIPILPFAFGMLWGTGSMTLGLSFAFIGLSLAYAINYGGQIIVGTMGPILIDDPAMLATGPGMVILLGVVTLLAGVVVCAYAGVLKSRDQQTGEGTVATAKNRVGILAGLTLAFLSGVLCACWVIAFYYGQQAGLLDKSAAHGNEAWRTTIPVTALILWGGSITACLFCAFKLTANGNWKRFGGPGIALTLLLALVMAVLHDGAVLLFGVGATRLAEGMNPGVAAGVGYAAFMSFAIITGNVNGFLTGEWKGVGAKAKQMILLGILVLVVGVCTVSFGKFLHDKASNEVAPTEQQEGGDADKDNGDQTPDPAKPADMDDADDQGADADNTDVDNTDVDNTEKPDDDDVESAEPAPSAEEEGDTEEKPDDATDADEEA